jgi:hypothetical protein
MVVASVMPGTTVSLTKAGFAAVTDTGADVVWFPAVSRATAVSVCAPLLAAVEFHSPR